MRPSACPNSCRTTRRNSSSVLAGVSHPKFIDGWFFGTVWQEVPIVDHEPEYLNETRTSAVAGLFMNTILRFAVSGAVQAFTTSLIRCCTEASPSMNATLMLEPLAHLFFVTNAALLVPAFGSSPGSHVKHH